jgi:hypothetical protein
MRGTALAVRGGGHDERPDARTKGDVTMIATIGIFPDRASTEHAVANLRAVGVPASRIRVLVPGSADAEVLKVPTSEAEQPGIGKAIGGVVGGAVGAAGGAAAAGVLVPVAGPIVAIGLVGAVLLSLGGAAAGGALEQALANGLPRDELFVYEDALRRGCSIVVVMADSADDQERAATALEASGAESVDAARKRWWIGLRDAEALEYRAAGLDFEGDEEIYRQGFEAAQAEASAGRVDRGTVTDLRARYPGAYRKPAFRRGYERGRAYRDRIAGTHPAGRRDT